MFIKDPSGKVLIQYFVFLLRVSCDPVFLVEFLDGFLEEKSGLEDRQQSNIIVMMDIQDRLRKPRLVHHKGLMLLVFQCQTNFQSQPLP